MCFTLFQNLRSDQGACSLPQLGVEHLHTVLAEAVAEPRPGRGHQGGVQFLPIAVGVAQAGDIKIKIDFTAGPDSVNNDAALVGLFREAGEDLLGPDRVEEIALPSMGGEDFSYYLRHVPGAMFRLGSALQKHAVGLHSPTFDIDEEALRIGAKMLATTAVLWFDPKKS